MKQLKFFLLPLALILIFSVVAVFRSGSVILLHFDETQLTVELADTYSHTEVYADILDIALVECPSEGEVLSGGENHGTHYGLRRSEELGNYEVCLTNQAANCVRVSSKEGLFFFNYEDTASTEAMYQSFLVLLD